MKTFFWLCRGSGWEMAFFLALLVLGTVLPYLLRGLP